MSDMIKNEYMLFTEEQIFEEVKSGVIKAIGTTAEVTDFAVCMGTEVNPETMTGKWYTMTPAGYGDVVVANADGSRGVAYASTQSGIRPVMALDNLDSIKAVTRKDLTGYMEADYGEYPQSAAERSVARELEKDYIARRLRKTGKNYGAATQEYEYQGNKYIRVRFNAPSEVTLTNGRTCKPGDIVWLKVEAVKWLYDDQEKILISRKILAGGITFCSNNYFDGDFTKTAVYTFLDGDFAKHIIPSIVKEMTEEEKIAFEKEIEETARRRNPYGLNFGHVTEEDIIRGAIESDVAVFLHGPSSEGKSARVKQIDPGCEIIYLRNATPDSLNGRSVYNADTGEMIDIPPTWYKKVCAKCEAEPDTFHVVFFDEINNALPSIQGMAFNIVLDREVNGLWKLPDNARVVAAGNDMQDSIAANQLAAPFFNRFAHVYINTTTEKWLAWARKNDIHPAIYSYIAYKNGETLRSEYTGEKPNADPRKWELASRMLYATGCPEMLRSLIGEEIAEEFVQFCNQPVITLERVLSGDYEEREIELLNTAERYATTMGLSQAQASDLDTVRAFTEKLGPEFRSVFDSMREL